MARTRKIPVSTGERVAVSGAGSRTRFGKRVGEYDRSFYSPPGIDLDEVREIYHDLGDPAVEEAALRAARVAIGMQRPHLRTSLDVAALILDRYCDIENSL